MLDYSLKNLFISSFSECFFFLLFPYQHAQIIYFVNTEPIIFGVNGTNVGIRKFRYEKTAFNQGGGSVS